MISHFVLWCYLLIQGMAQIHRSSAFSKRRGVTVEEWTKAQALRSPCHPKKYPRSTSIKAWGCPRGTPSSSAKIMSPFNTLYFYCFMHYAFLLERQLFLVFSFV
jgi:hypothetical protein